MITVTDDNGRLAHRANDASLRAGVAICGTWAVVDVPAEDAPRCMHCTDAERRLNPDGSYKPTARPGDYMEASRV